MPEDSDVAKSHIGNIPSLLQHQLIRFFFHSVMCWLVVSKWNLNFDPKAPMSQPMWIELMIKK